MHFEIVGEVFGIETIARGKGVRLQKFKDGGLSDACAFKLSAGLTWLDSSGRNWTGPGVAEALT